MRDASNDLQRAWVAQGHLLRTIEMKAESYAFILVQNEGRHFGLLPHAIRIITLQWHATGFGSSDRSSKKTSCENTNSEIR